MMLLCYGYCVGKFAEVNSLGFVQMCPCMHCCAFVFRRNSIGFQLQLFPGTCFACCFVKRPDCFSEIFGVSFACCDNVFHGSLVFFACFPCMLDVFCSLAAWFAHVGTTMAFTWLLFNGCVGRLI